MTKAELHDLTKMAVPEFIDTSDTLVMSKSFQYYYENRTELNKWWFSTIQKGYLTVDSTLRSSPDMANKKGLP
jgi:hypothetical protein